MSSIQAAANAVKLLQACTYKSVNTGLFLTSLVATIIVKLNMLILVFTLYYKVLQLLSITKTNITILLATNQLKNSIYRLVNPGL